MNRCGTKIFWRTMGLVTKKRRTNVVARNTLLLIHRDVLRTIVTRYLDDLDCRALATCSKDTYRLLREARVQRIQESFAHDACAAKGYVRLMEWLIDVGIWCDVYWVRTYAAQAGQLAVLQHVNSWPGIRSPNVCARAAAYGQMHVLKWARANGYPWDSYTTFWASEKGQLQALQWAVAHDAPFKPLQCKLIAARNGHKAVMEWLNTKF